MEIKAFWVSVKFKDSNSNATVALTKCLVEGFNKAQAKRIAEYQLENYALNFLSVDENDNEAMEIAWESDILELDEEFLKKENLLGMYFDGVCESGGLKITRK